MRQRVAGATVASRRPEMARRSKADGLVLAARRGDGGARQRVVTANLGLVRAVAARYRDIGLPLDDLMQEGALGLLDAIDRYDPRKNREFETFARFRIRRAIRDALT